MMRLILSVALVSGTLAAQCTRHSNGPLAGVPVAIFRADPGVPTHELYYKGAGFLNGAAVKTWPTSRGRPDFNFRAHFARCKIGRVVPVVNSFSIGNDWVLADDKGRIKVANAQWGWLDLSVTDKSRGAVGSAIRAEAAQGPGADVFTYVLPGSDATVFAKDVIGRTMRSQDSREIDVGKGRREISAIDRFVPIYNSSARVANMMPGLDNRRTLRAFFTLSARSAKAIHAVNATWFKSAAFVSGATILQMSYSARSGWSCPSVFKTWRDLGLKQTDDIDGLAVDLEHKRLLLSTVRDPARRPQLNQILFVNCASNFSTGSATPVPYTDPTNNKPVTDNIGLIEVDDVDAICSADPAFPRYGGSVNVMFYYLGSPFPALLSSPAQLGASAVRDRVGVQDVYRTYGIGWLNSGPAPGTFFLAITPAFAVSPLIVASQQMRTVNNPICGDPKHVKLNVPAALYGATAWLRWIHVDKQNILKIADAWPIGIRL